MQGCEKRLKLYVAVVACNSALQDTEADTASYFQIELDCHSIISEL